jgi:hypothetical protein
MTALFGIGRLNLEPRRITSATIAPPPFCSTGDICIQHLDWRDGTDLKLLIRAEIQKGLKAGKFPVY